MEYFELTDAMRSGDVIGVDGRKHYRFVFGPYKWERTTAFQAYLTEGTPLYGSFRKVAEADAQELLLKKGRFLSNALAKADKMMGRNGEPYAGIAEALTDWEEKLTALLNGICVCFGQTGEALRQKGFPLNACMAVALLQGNTGESYSEYLRKIRDNRIARNVKLMELSQKMGEGNASAAELKSWSEARQYLYGDIPEVSELRASGAQPPAFVPAMTVFQRLRPEALEGRKIPHGMSNPVLRKSGEELQLAFFVYTYNREELRAGAIHRPASWITADITTGKKIRTVSCGTEDFSPAPYEVLCSTQNPNADIADPDFYRETYAELDRLRLAWLENGEVSAKDYERYLSRILKAVPPAYHRFYRELSKL